MKKYPLISIIVPVYKVEKYLPKCLDSIISQSYQNIEIVLVDDGSPDKCGKICDQYAAKDARIKVIHKENAGVTEARITGLDNSSGEYVTFIDSDDYICQNYITHLYGNIEKYKVDVSCCQLMNVYKNSQIKDSRPEIGYFEKKRINDFMSTDFLYDYKTGRAGFFVGQGGKMYKREYLPEALAAGINLIMGEDILMLFNLMNRINSMYISPACLYFYVQHDSQATRNVKLETWNSLIKEWERIIEYDDKRYLTNQLAYRVLHHLRFFMINSLKIVGSYQRFVKHIELLIKPQVINSFLFGYDFQYLRKVDCFLLFLIKKKYYKTLYFYCRLLNQIIIFKKTIKNTQV